MAFYINKLTALPILLCLVCLAMLLSDVCLSVAYIGPNSRTERPRKTKIGTEVAHVTRDSDTTFKVKRSKGQLVADVLNSQHAGTSATWRINTKILSTCKGRHIVSPRAQLVKSNKSSSFCRSCFLNISRYLTDYPVRNVGLCLLCIRASVTREIHGNCNQSGTVVSIS